MELISGAGTLAEEKRLTIEELMLARSRVGAVDVGTIVNSEDDDAVLPASTSENEIRGAADNSEDS